VVNVWGRSVATVAINNSTNAALLLCIRILGRLEMGDWDQLVEYAKKREAIVMEQEFGELKIKDWSY
jgi:phosphoribosylcarboxyaminoimidazole (NCAIR) mutase